MLGPGWDSNRRELSHDQRVLHANAGLWPGGLGSDMVRRQVVTAIQGRRLFVRSGRDTLRCRPSLVQV